MSFSRKFSGNLTQEFLLVHSDGVRVLLLTASGVKIWKFYQFCFSNGVLKFCWIISFIISRKSANFIHKHYILLCFLGFSNLYRMPPILCEVALSIFSGFTGYVWQEDNLFFWKGSFDCSFSWGRSNLATLLSIPSESGEYLISFFLLFHFYIFTWTLGTMFILSVRGG